MQEPADDAHPIDVLVVGAGHAGSAVAAAAALAGLTARAIDPRGDMARSETGRGLAVMRGSVDGLRSLGLWPRIAEIAEPIRAAWVCDVEADRAIRYEAAEHGDEPFGYGVAEGALERALRDACAEAGARISRDAIEATTIRGETIAARLASGETVEARLVVGADGRASWCRRHAGLDGRSWSYDQTALTFAVELAQPHGGVVREIMLEEGPLAFLPLPGRRASVTWAMAPASAERLAADPACALETMETAMERAFGERIGARAPGRITRFPLGGLHARRYVARRLALIGDAAHGVHPIHAQGFNMAVGDVVALIDVIGRARETGRDIGGADALLAYDRARRARNETRAAFTDGLARLFSTPLAPLPAGPLLAGRKAAMTGLARSRSARRAAVAFGANA